MSNAALLSFTPAYKENVPEQLDPASLFGRYPGVQALTSLKLNPIVEYRGCKIDFNSDAWKLDSLNTGMQPVSSLRIRFTDIPFKDELKLFCLMNFSYGSLAERTIISNVRDIQSDLAVIGEAGLRLSHLERLKAHFDSKGSAYQHTAHNRWLLSSFLVFRQAYFGKTVSKAVLEYLDKRDIAKIKASRKANKFDEIPYDYLNRLIDVCLMRMRDESYEIRSRIMAAAILIYSQIGMRTSQLTGAKTEALKVYPAPIGDGAPICYLEFSTLKRRGKNQIRKTQKAIANEIVVEAYEFLMKACEPYRKRIGTDALIVMPKQKCKHIDHKLISAILRIFVADNHNLLPCVNTQDDYPELQTTKVSNIEAREEVKRGLKPDDVIVYPTIHQFRVSVCTILYERGIDLRYIKEHMGHLTEDMTTYYVRSEKRIDRECSELVYGCIYGDGSKLLGKKADEFVDRVSEFILKKSGNTACSTDEAVRIASDEFPLRKKVGGWCNRCGQVIPCPENKATDEILCAFGLCPNHCHMYFMAAQSYSVAKQMERSAIKNKESGHLKAAKCEERKLANVTESTLMPELVELEGEIKRRGLSNVLQKFPDLEDIASHLPEIIEEARSWMK